jgi:hypothetical protein
MPVHIDHVQTDLDVRPPLAGEGLRSGALATGFNGIDRAMLERLRPLVLLILQEELDRLRRQQG